MYTIFDRLGSNDKINQIHDPVFFYFCRLWLKILNGYRTTDFNSVLKNLFNKIVSMKLTWKNGLEVK